MNYLILSMVIAVMVVPLAHGEEDAEWTDWREDTEIKVSIIGNSVIDLNSQNRLIRAYVEVINFDPADGYFFMHIIQPTTNKTLAEQHIVIKEKGNGDAGANVAYLLNDEEVWENGVPQMGDYKIIITTESGDSTASTSFSVIARSTFPSQFFPKPITNQSNSHQNDAEYVSKAQKLSEDETIIVEEAGTIIEEVRKIPEWIRNIFILYAEGSISDQELINAITFLIEQKIIEI